MASLTDKQRAFIDHYLICRNATEAARLAGYSSPRQMGSENLSKPYIRQQIDSRLNELTISANEVLFRISEQATASLSMFFKVVEEWTFYPLPLDDVLDAVEVIDPETDETRISYCVRRVAIDPDRLVDPNYAHLLSKVSSTARGGLTIELHSQQNALQMLGKHYALFTDTVKHEDWRDTALEYIRNGEVSYKALADEFGTDLATELFAKAGKPVTVGTGTGEDHRAD